MQSWRETSLHCNWKGLKLLVPRTFGGKTPNCLFIIPPCWKYLQIYKLLLISSWHRNWPRSMDLSGGHDGARYGRGWLCYQCTAVTAAGSSAHLHDLREHLNRRKELKTTEATSTGGLRAHNESLSLFRHHRGKCPGAGWTQSSSTITVVPLLQIII